MRLHGHSIGRKLNLLIVPPLVAAVLVAVPFLLGQAGDAGSASGTATSARQVRELGGLIWELQKERVLTAAHLAAPTGDGENLKRQHGNVDKAVEDVRAALGSTMSDELTNALVRLGSLTGLRQNALRGGASSDGVARTYHATISAIIDSLRLVPQPTGDAEGTRQLTALEALLRATEQHSLRDTGLIIAATRRQTGQDLLNDAVMQADAFTERFVQQADAEHAALVVTVEEGPEARRVGELATRLPGQPNPAFAAEALTAVTAQAELRKAAQDTVTDEIAAAASARATSATVVAWTVGAGGAALFVLVVWLVIVVRRSIANPLRNLTDAAGAVADLAGRELVRVSDTETADEQVPLLREIEVSSGNELGRLAEAFNRVQGTAAQLVERQAVTRQNVSLMFANVAKRTQSLVSRQLALVDELERDEQNERLLASLYQLDHLSTRLRRTADNLLVIAGAREDGKLSGPMELGTVLRSALAEIEDYQRVRLGSVSKITMPSSLGSDLILLFAELLDNATSFSPPESTVEVGTARAADGSCVVKIVDHGIGMTEARLAEENLRLVDRERLDITPTSVLGLFVVGRLARRHSLAVDLLPTEGGGVTARVMVPSRLLRQDDRPSRSSLLAPAPPAPLDGRVFGWFMDEPTTTLPVMSDQTTTLPVVSDEPEHLAGELTAEITLVSSAIARVAVQPQPAPPPPAMAPEQAGRAGLTRRVPGANLAPSLRTSTGTTAKPAAPAAENTASWQDRDPAAERAALDAFADGLALGAAAGAGTQPTREGTE
ncbi:sensor histidine kinase [Lentzea nigeriaca]|uniref:sensor histidine kinase n=1 Tax=Lentzea nigeriaca TaxID=1128665 RepID=UPI0027DC1D52|nr:nitrate- and nitrite sensing domain-containing protein [Lentzea nigeriaca]MBM7858688.1 signal transduction histidine kinase [Lentzea nigeriaca]